MAKRKQVFTYNDDYRYLKLGFTLVGVHSEVRPQCVVLKSLSSQLFERSKTSSAPRSKP